MPRAKKSKLPRKLYVPAVASTPALIATDRYDRRMWSEILESAPAMRELATNGEKIAPHFSALVADLFAALFKLNIGWTPRENVRAAAALNRSILENLVRSAPFEVLKNRTSLEEDKAAIGAMVLATNVLDSIRAGKVANERELRDLWDIANQEDGLASRADTVKL